MEYLHKKGVCEIHTSFSSEVLVEREKCNDYVDSIIKNKWKKFI